MRILNIQSQPIANFRYWNVQPGGQSVLEEDLPIQLGSIEGLPESIDALIVTSDLQGKLREGTEEFLLGIKLPKFLADLIERELPQVSTQKIGVLLCGDLFATLEKRGGLGDVKEVWQTFKQHFKWVAGVAGNHDYFGKREEIDRFKEEAGIHLLHKEIRSLDGITVAGLGGIIGNVNKINRMAENDYLQTLKDLLNQQPNILLQHQGPDFPPIGLPGHEGIRSVVEGSPRTLIFCGHVHWRTPSVEVGNGSQIVNAEKRVIILINSRSEQLAGSQ